MRTIVLVGIAVFASILGMEAAAYAQAVKSTFDPGEFQKFQQVLKPFDNSDALFCPTAPANQPASAGIDFIVRAESRDHYYSILETSLGHSYSGMGGLIEMQNFNDMTGLTFTLYPIHTEHPGMTDALPETAILVYRFIDHTVSPPRTLRRAVSLSRGDANFFQFIITGEQISELRRQLNNEFPAVSGAAHRSVGFYVEMCAQKDEGRWSEKLAFQINTGTVRQRFQSIFPPVYGFIAEPAR